MSGLDQGARLDLAAREWRRFRLIEDAGRGAEDLLAEGIALSVASLALAESFASR